MARLILLPRAGIGWFFLQTGRCDPDENWLLNAGQHEPVVTVGWQASWWLEQYFP